MKQFVLLFSILFSITLIHAQEWEQVAGLPDGAADARHHPVTFSVGNFGYLLTGAVNGTAAKDFMRYDATTDTWEDLPDFPGAARSFSYATSRGTKAYIGFGGADGTPYNDFWEYDTETEEWTRLSDCPCSPRYHPAFIQLDDRIYVGMGNNPSNLRDWWEYDIPTDTWTQKDDLPGPTRHHPFYFGIGDIAYVGLGHGSTGGSAANIYNDFYMFDPSTDEWTRLDDFPGEARVAGTQFDYNGKGYILSGDGDNHNHMEEGEFWEYDPSADEWTQLTSHPGNSSRWAPGSFVIDNYAYLTCGLSIDRLESDMMRFELEPLSTSTTEFAATPIAVFPNPTTSMVFITKEITDFEEVRLVNSYGQLVQTVTSNQVDVKAYPAGVYYLQFFQDGDMRTEKISIVK
ncbi:MAG: kelch repeat-containing protein [Bacteroidota bacterium]